MQAFLWGRKKMKRRNMQLYAYRNTMNVHFAQKKLLIDGKPGYSDGPIIDKYPLALPVIDVTSIGAGGGSIGWVEPETGVLRVGPQSAGARPGPACYEKGGGEPTVTDANLVLGRLNPDFFLGGRMRLYPEKARHAIKTRVADPLGMTVEDAAAAMIEIVDAQMSDIIRKVTVERGQDPEHFTIFSYGGAGGLHCDAYSSVLGCPEVVVPSVASVFSAYGIAGSDAKRVMEMSDPMRFPFDLARIRDHFKTLESSIVTQMKEQRLPIGRVHLTRYVHLLFKGQVHTVRVPVTDFDLKAPDRGQGIVWRFVDLYELRYGKGTAYTEAGIRGRSSAPTTFVAQTRGAGHDAAFAKPIRHVLANAIAAQAMLMAASTIRPPSKALEKYSALPWPWAWSSSAGNAARVNMASAITAPARLTSDSSASESRPTDPVMRHAAALRTMVESAAPMDSHA